MKKIALLLAAIPTLLSAQNLSKYIVVDQFGYRPSAEKVAFIRNPMEGFDSDESFTPGSTYALVEESTGDQVFTGTAISWNGGATDNSSGDQVWRFDFSSYTDIGTYYILDVDQNVKSHSFTINAKVYEEVLKHAVRSYFYQRSGHEKLAQYAGEGWADDASHVGPGQDLEARLYSDPDNASTEKDVHGGWYDAGDLNKYTPWTANVIVTLLTAYQENPYAFGDDYNIPESGNGIPDLVDEIIYGLESLLRLQHDDGSMIAVVDAAHASPPSAATGVTLYGGVNTHSAWASAAAMAYGATVLAEFSGLESLVSDLTTAAEKAYEWAEANPNVQWRNNDANSGTAGIASGQQETNDYGRQHGNLRAALFLYELTGDTDYRDYFDAHYDDIHLKQWTFAYPYEEEEQQTLLHYTTLEGATTAVVNDIKSVYNSAMEKETNFDVSDNDDDAYKAFLDSYTWGSNRTKSAHGNMFHAVYDYQINNSRNEDAQAVAEHYLHNIHGANPLSLCYLSNMYAYGGDQCVNEFFHTWFTDGSTDWDRVGESTYGPPPGYLTGGPNPSYNYDGCCPDNCGGSFNNNKCTETDISDAVGQPAQKSYLDINTSWPINSWEITENSTGYQAQYIKLLSKFVDTRWDCEGVVDGGGCSLTTSGEQARPLAQVYVVSALNQLQISNSTAVTITVTDLLGKQVAQTSYAPGKHNFSTSSWAESVYLISMSDGRSVQQQKIRIAR